jgi:magnesium transporter
MANIYTNILSGTMDAFASIISNNLNVVMKRLTSVTIVLMIPTLVASFYGMNVHVPLEDTAHAFYLIMGISLAISVVLIWFFVRKKWF